MVSFRLVAAVSLAAILSMSLMGCGGNNDSPTPAPTGKPDSSTTAPLMQKCAPAMPDMDCFGHNLKTVHGVNTTDECCEHCSSTKDCGAYTHDAKKNTCILKRWCDYLVASAGKHSSMPEQLPETPPPGCMEPEMGQGYRCESDGSGDLGTVPGDSAGDCCDLCSQTKGCLVYSFSKSSKTCSLKRSCPVKPKDDDFVTGWVANPEQEQAARYQVGRGSYELSGYQCGGGSATTVIFYPKGPGPFNVVVYGHGSWGYIDGSDNWLQTVSSLGLIVIAPFQGRDEHPCKDAFADDLLNAIQGSKEGGAELHPALGTANWTRTGVFGHSKGAKVTTLAASKGKETHGISAAVCSCDAPSEHYPTTVPTMFTTGTLDSDDDGVPREGQIRDYWEKSSAEPKVYVNLKDAYHMEIQEGMRLNLLTGRFLSCHVSGKQEDCDVIYGTGQDSICEVNDYADGSCCVQRASELNNEFCYTKTTTTSDVPTTETGSTSETTMVSKELVSKTLPQSKTSTAPEDPSRIISV